MPLALALTTMLSFPSVVMEAIAMRTWYTVWRNEKSGTAHALFLTSLLMLAIIAVLYLRSLYYFYRGVIPPHYPVNVLIWGIVFFAALVQFALSRGYFNTEDDI